MAKQTTLKIVCMYCNVSMGEKDGQGVEGTSAGICEACWTDIFPDIPYPDPSAKTCEVCGHKGTDVHEWPTYKDGRGKTEYQCDDYEVCLTRKYKQNGGVQ